MRLACFVIATLAACSSGEHVRASKPVARDSTGVTAQGPDSTAARAADSRIVVTDSVYRDQLARNRIVPHVEDGFDSARVTAVGRYFRTPCFRHARYTVVVIDTSDDVGEDVIVRATPKGSDADDLRGSCGLDSLAGDFVLRNTDASYFIGLRGPMLFMDNGTGSIRGLTIYDIPSRRRVLQRDGYELAGWRNDSTLAVWLPTEAPTTGCKDEGGYSMRVDSLYVLNLRTLDFSPSDRARCSSLE